MFWILNIWELYYVCRYSLVQSLVYYGLPFWDGTYKDYMTPLNTTINGLIKVTISKPYLYSTNYSYIDFDV